MMKHPNPKHHLWLNPFSYWNYFSEKDVTAIDDISFSAFKTEITALLGHNGAGKTTTMSILSGTVLN
jgi:ABC-type multidrug transport system ATPase subunit